MRVKLEGTSTAYASVFCSKTILEVLRLRLQYLLAARLSAPAFSSSFPSLWAPLYAYLPSKRTRPDPLSFCFARKRALDLSLATEATWHRAALTHLSGLLEPFQIADKLIWPRCINSNAYHLPSLRSQTVGLTEKRLSG